MRNEMNRNSEFTIFEENRKYRSCFSMHRKNIFLTLWERWSVLTRKKLTYEYISSRMRSGSGGEPTPKRRSRSRSTLSERRLRAMTISSAPANTAMKKSVWTNWNWFGNMQQSLGKEQTTITTFSRKADSRTACFRHRNAEKYSCLPLPIFFE